MSTILREDDFETGMLITGHSYVYDYDDDYCDDDPEPFFVTFGMFKQGQPIEDPHEKYNGKIYYLRGVNLPYIAIEPANPAHHFTNQNATMSINAGANLPHDVVYAAAGTAVEVVDIRRYKFTRITKEFAQAVLGDQIV